MLSWTHATHTVTLVSQRKPWAELVNLDWPEKVIHLAWDDTEAYRDIQRDPAALLSVTHVETHTHTRRDSAWCQSHHSLPVSRVDLAREMRSGKQTFTEDKWSAGSDRRFLVWRLAVNQIYCCLLCACILYLLISLWRECVLQSGTCASSISDFTQGYEAINHDSVAGLQQEGLRRMERQKRSWWQ